MINAGLYAKIQLQKCLVISDCVSTWDERYKYTEHPALLQ